MSEGIDLGPIVDSIYSLANNVQVVNSNIAAVDDKVEAVAQLHSATRDRLEELYQEFTAFVAADAQQKERQFAQTRLIEVKQDIEKRFGHFDITRRTTVGVLQATDLGVVREETLKTATEELMLNTPGYWLAPALIALTGWFTDNRSVAEKALAEAVSRDDSKTSLFFSLVARRARRAAASAHWLKRYFQIQSPMSMEREVVVMLDSLANGVFGGAALTECSQVFQQWLAELEQQAGFLDEQRKRWAEKLDVMAPRIGQDEYPTLRGHSPTWPRLEHALSAARRNQEVHSFFETLFTGEIIVPPNLEAAVDGLLDSLVRNFDEQELPARRELRLLHLVVQEGGNRDAAKRLMDAEADSLEERTNFAALLTNSAMSPEQFGATRATQRYAVSRSRQWIAAAQQDLVGRDRSTTPQDVELTCGFWKGTTQDGSDEQRLSGDLTAHYEDRTRKAVEAVKIAPAARIALIAGGLVGLVMISNGAVFMGLILAAAGGAYFYSQYSGLGKNRANIRQQLERERDQASRVLRAALAELVDLRRDIAKEDAKAEVVVEFLQSLSSPQFVLQRPEQPRATVA